MPNVIKLSLDNNGNLFQSDKGNTDVGNMAFRTVKWVVIDNKIASFKIVPISPTNPWTDLPSNQHGKNQQLTAIFGVDPQEWEYKIEWIDARTSSLHIIDPKIVIQPVIDWFIAPIYIAIFFACITGILAVKVKNLRAKLRSGLANRSVQNLPLS